MPILSLKGAAVVLNLYERSLSRRVTEERLLLVRKNRNDCRNGSLFNVSEGLLHSASVMLEQHDQCAVRTEARRLGAR